MSSIKAIFVYPGVNDFGQELLKKSLAVQQPSNLSLIGFRDKIKS